MGRGSSGASGGGGGGASTAGLQPATKTLQPPSMQDVAKGNVLPKGGVPFDKFEKMTDDEKADVVADALSTGVPMFLDDSGMQRFAYYTGMSDKPKVVSDSQLDKTQGTELFRTVSDAYNRQTDIGYSSTDICKQVAQGDFTMYSDSGGSVHGKAIYFANTVNRSVGYGSGRNDKTMRAKVTGGKGIDEHTLTNAYHNALSRGDKLAKACSKAGRGSDVNLYGLAKGYTHMTDRYTGYTMVFNRKCLTISSTFKDSRTLGGKW